MSNNEQHMNIGGAAVLDPNDLPPYKRGLAEYASHVLGYLEIGQDTLRKAYAALEEAGESTANIPEAGQVLRSIQEGVSKDFAEITGCTIPEGAIVEVGKFSTDDTTTASAEGKGA